MGNIRLYGSTSGYTELAPPAVAPDGVLSLPSGTGTIATQDYAAGAGGLVHINTTTFSASSAVNINDVFSAAYENYKVVCYLTSNQADTNVRIRLRVSGTDASGSNYSRQSLQSGNTTVSGSRSSNSAELIVSVAGTTSPSFITMDFARPFSAVSTLFLGKGSGRDIETWDFSGFHSLTTSYDGMSLIAAAGTMTGTIRIYGYKN